MNMESAVLLGELNTLKEKAFDPLLLLCSEFMAEPESQEYKAVGFALNQKTVQYRCAKVTPTKIGQFVTLWKRDGVGEEIRPYHVSDNLDLAIIAANQGNRQGYFIFPHFVLKKQGIVQDNKPGKRGFRVYPIWDKPTSKQALKTQAWQLEYFFELSVDCELNLESIKPLFHCVL